MKAASVCLVALCLAACSKNIDTPEAIKQGIIKDIGKKVDIDHMDVSVESVSFRDKEANASVSFRPKGGDPKQSITMKYVMERQGDEWHVKGRNMDRHEQSDPNAGPGTGSGPGPLPPGATMPPGHPSTSGAAGGQLPPGHPPMTSPQQ